MTKQLILIRHAEANWGNGNLNDFDRTLTDQGLANATQMAQHLLKLNIKPSFIVSSPAVRALTTAKVFGNKWGISDQNIEQEKAIYEANEFNLLKLINSFNDQHDSIALFGHNPGISNFANLLCNNHIYDLPTCGVAVLQFFFESWNLISTNTGNIILFNYPKNLDDVYKSN